MVSRYYGRICPCPKMADLESSALHCDCEIDEADEVAFSIKEYITPDGQRSGMKIEMGWL